MSIAERFAKKQGNIYFERSRDGLYFNVLLQPPVSQLLYRTVRDRRFPERSIQTTEEGKISHIEHAAHDFGQLPAAQDQALFEHFEEVGKEFNYEVSSIIKRAGEKTVQVSQTASEASQEV